MDNETFITFCEYLLVRTRHDAATLPLQAILIGGAVSFGLWANRRRMRLMPQPWQPRGMRVFASTLKDWPFVMQRGFGQYTVHAPHWPPLRSTPNRLILAVIFAALALALWQGSMLASLIMGGAGIWIVGHWPPASPQPANIWLDGNYTRWVSPDGRRQEIPTLVLRMQVLRPHRFAQATEWRDQQETQTIAGQYQTMTQAFAALDGRLQQAPPGGQPRPSTTGLIRTLIMPPPRSAQTYQVASELVAHRGPNDREWLVIAEFGDDPHGHHADALLSAIEYVKDKCLEETGAAAGRREERQHTGPREARRRFQ